MKRKINVVSVITILHRVKSNLESERWAVFRNMGEKRLLYYRVDIIYKSIKDEYQSIIINYMYVFIYSEPICI